MMAFLQTCKWPCWWNISSPHAYASSQGVLYSEVPYDRLHCATLFVTGPTAAPPSVYSTVGTRTATFSWDPIECIERNGFITGYMVIFHDDINRNLSWIISNISLGIGTSRLQDYPLVQPVSFKWLESITLALGPSITTKKESMTSWDEIHYVLYKQVLRI